MPFAKLQEYNFIGLCKYSTLPERITDILMPQFAIIIPSLGTNIASLGMNISRFGMRVSVNFSTHAKYLQRP